MSNPEKQTKLHEQARDVKLLKLKAYRMTGKLEYNVDNNNEAYIAVLSIITSIQPLNVNVCISGENLTRKRF